MLMVMVVAMVMVLVIMVIDGACGGDNSVDAGDFDGSCMKATKNENDVWREDTKASTRVNRCVLLTIKVRLDHS